MWKGWRAPRDSVLSSPTNSPGMTLPRRAWVRLNRLRTGVGRFRSCLYKWGMASSAAFECGAEEQTVDHVVLQCPISRPPHGLHGPGWWDNWMAVRHLPLDQVRPSSSWKNWLKRWSSLMLRTEGFPIQTNLAVQFFMCWKKTNNKNLSFF